MPTRLLLAVCLLLPSAALAQDDAPTTRPDDAPMTMADRRAAYIRLEQQVHEAFAGKDYPAAADACRKQLALAPDQDGPHYNLACALARLGKPEAALDALADALKAGYHDADHMQADPDLESLRKTDRFAELADQAAANHTKYLANLYEPGEEIAGVKTVEGNPPGGLRWRLRMSPDATKDKPHRLVIWLHPSGGSMNGRVEKLAPALAKRGWALLLPTAKDWRFWGMEATEQLLKVSLPEVAKIEGIDATRPVLLGYSAGGQAALRLWMDDPSRFGGLIIDAAYPVRRTATGYETESPPKGEAASKVPLYVFVGDKDGGARVWKQATEPWREQGIPLKVEYIPGAGHAWVIGQAQFTRICQWLEAVAAGRVPNAPPPTTQPQAAPEREGEPQIF